MARIGNLGWDDTTATIVARAKEVLTRAGISENSYTGLSAVRLEGSTAELVFPSQSALDAARLSVKAL